MSRLTWQILAGVAVAVACVSVGRIWRAMAFGERTRAAKLGEAKVGLARIEPASLAARRGFDALTANPDTPEAVRSPIQVTTDPRPSRTSENIARVVPQSHEERVHLFSNTFDREPQDPNWRADAEASLEKLYRDPLFAGLTTQVACKTTLCRVTFEYTDAAKGKAAVRSLLTKHAWPGRAFTRHDRKRQNGFSYIARQGTSLPRAAG